MRRNRDVHGRYQAEQAHQLSEQRRTAHKASYRYAGWLSAVDNLLRLDLSTKPISGALGRRGIEVSHEWIYQRVLRDQRAGGALAAPAPPSQTLPQALWLAGSTRENS